MGGPWGLLVAAALTATIASHGAAAREARPAIEAALEAEAIPAGFDPSHGVAAADGPGPGELAARRARVVTGAPPDGPARRIGRTSPRGDGLSAAPTPGGAPPALAAARARRAAGHTEPA